MSNWKTIGETSNNNKMHDFEVNKEITGILFNKRNNIGANNSNIYDIEVGDEVIGVWGTSILDRKMEEVEVGEEVRIIYNGKKISDKTKRQYKDFTVQSRKVEVSDVIDTTNLPF